MSVSLVLFRVISLITVYFAKICFLKKIILHICPRTHSDILIKRLNSIFKILQCLTVTCSLRAISHCSSQGSLPFRPVTSRLTFLLSLFHLYLLRALGLCSKSCVRLFAMLQSVALQAPLSTGFSRQEYCSGWPFSPPGDLPNLEIELVSPVLGGGFFSCSAITEAYSLSPPYQLQSQRVKNTASTDPNLCFIIISLETLFISVSVSPSVKWE